MTTFDNRNIFKIWKKKTEQKHETFFSSEQIFPYHSMVLRKINWKWEELTVIFCFGFFKNVSVDGETL